MEFVMPGLVPGIHVLAASIKDVDGRDKPGHDTLVHAMARARLHRLIQRMARSIVRGINKPLFEPGPIGWK
jgi:hypothetical protein